MSNSALQFLGISAMLDREYRNSPAYQWARELTRNGIEAEATRIHFGVEWQGVQATGVYRLQYSDNGVGMPRKELRQYMATLGKGGKVVGGPHDNYALGSRMTLLPWNPEGVVVISMVDGVAHMVKMKYDPDAADGEGEYVLEEVDWVDEAGVESIGTVYPPYVDPDLEIDWNLTIPDFITEAGHGTTFILLGKGPNDDTFHGDPERQESFRYLTRKYFNTRFWDLPGGVTMQCTEFLKPDQRDEWPRSAEDRDLYQNRTISGARYYVEYQPRSGASTVEASGTVELRDGTRAHWWMRPESRVDTGGMGSASGYIAVLYRGELYGHAYAAHDDGDTRAGAAVYRQFGIGSDDVRKRVFIVLEPPEYNETLGTPGVAPSTGRADLYWMGAGLSPRSVKPGDWSEEFAELMPEEIANALSAAFADSRASDEAREERLKRVMSRVSKRWRVVKARVAKAGDTTTTPILPGTAPRAPIDSPTQVRRPARGRKKVVVRGRSGTPSLGQPGTGSEPAEKTRVTAGLPTYSYVSEDDLADRGMIAAWQGPSKEFPNGRVLIDKTHPVIRGQVEYWQSQYPRAVAEQVEQIILDVYGDVSVAKVSHVLALTGSVIPEDSAEKMLENPALTVSLLGLVSEDSVISPRLGGLGAKRKRTDESEQDDPVDDVDDLGADSAEAPEVDDGSAA